MSMVIDDQIHKKVLIFPIIDINFNNSIEDVFNESILDYSLYRSNYTCH